MVPPSALTEAEVTAWIELEARAIEPNVYMSPHFVLPALKYLDPSMDAHVILVERFNGTTWDTIGVAVLSASRASRSIPFPVLAEYRSRHTYLSGPLLDGDDADAAANELFAAIVALAAWSRWCIVHWPLLPCDGPLYGALHAAAREHGLSWEVLDVLERPILTNDPAPAAAQETKDVARRWRRLRELGDARWTVHRGAIRPETAERFLELEHDGWKGEAGTSLLSSRRDAQFFRDMVGRFGAEGRALFTEIHLGGSAIASSANFVSGREGFAFKVGWATEYKRLGPALLNEVELMRQYDSVCPDLLRIDSGASVDSFIGALWTHRRRLASVCIPLGRTGRALWWLRERAVRAAR